MTGLVVFVPTPSAGAAAGCQPQAGISRPQSRDAAQRSRLAPALPRYLANHQGCRGPGSGASRVCATIRATRHHNERATPSLHRRAGRAIAASARSSRANHFSLMTTASVLLFSTVAHAPSEPRPRDEKGERGAHPLRQTARDNATYPQTSPARSLLAWSSPHRPRLGRHRDPRGHCAGHERGAMLTQPTLSCDAPGAHRQRSADGNGPHCRRGRHRYRRDQCRRPLESAVAASWSSPPPSWSSSWPCTGRWSRLALRHSTSGYNS